MRKPETIERLYLDFDGFFASVEQQADSRLRGKPVGVVPFEGTSRTCVIACSREAKLKGVKNVMPVDEARRICPELILVPQKPDLYRRAHNTLLAEIESVIPIDTIKSIDELTCKLDDEQRSAPLELAAKIKDTLEKHVGSYITCSIGFASNRQLAKMACKIDKPNGVTIWQPEDLPAPLFRLKLSDIPGVGSRLEQRLLATGICSIEQLYNIQPKHMRKLWHSVTGERLWYALHGYDIQAPESERGMFGHGRVLPPEARSLPAAKEICRLLLIKAARRLRRENYYCSGLWLWLSIKDGNWSSKIGLPFVHDDQAVLTGLETLWTYVERDLHIKTAIFRVGVTLYGLCPDSERQLDMLIDDDKARQKWERVNTAIDNLNNRYGGTVVSLGLWNPPKGGHVGGKISYTRIPSAEDFW